VQIGESHHCLLRGFCVWGVRLEKDRGFGDNTSCPGCCCETKTLPFGNLNWQWKQCPMYRFYRFSVYRLFTFIYLYQYVHSIFSFDQIFLAKLDHRKGLSLRFWEAEPALLEPGGNDADHEWVRTSKRSGRKASKTSEQ
jgi:hypothetical protein